MNWNAKCLVVLMFCTVILKFSAAQHPAVLQILNNYQKLGNYDMLRQFLLSLFYKLYGEQQSKPVSLFKSQS